MDMSVGARARLKSHAAATGTHVIIGGIQRINTHFAGKNLIRAFDGGLLAIADNRLDLARFCGSSLIDKKTVVAVKAKTMNIIAFFMRMPPFGSKCMEVK